MIRRQMGVLLGTIVSEQPSTSPAVKGRSLRRWLIAAAVLCLAALGCSSQPARVGPRPPGSYEIVGRSEGGACGLLFLGVIPIGVNSRTERAYAEAVHGRGTGLIDTELQYTWWFIPYVGTLHCTTIIGTVIR